MKDDFETQLTIANIRHSIDTRDDFYAQEIAYWDETCHVFNRF